MRLFQRIPKGGVIRLGLCKQQIFPNTAGKEPERLGDVAEQPPHSGGAWDVSPLGFQIYPTLLGVIKSQNEAEQRAFPASGHTHQASPAIQRETRGKITQDRLIFTLVGKGNVFKHDGAKDVVLPRRLPRSFFRQRIQLIQPCLRRTNGGQPGLDTRQGGEWALEHRQQL